MLYSRKRLSVPPPKPLIFLRILPGCICRFFSIEWPSGILSVKKSAASAKCSVDLRWFCRGNLSRFAADHAGPAYKNCPGSSCKIVADRPIDPRTLYFPRRRVCRTATRPSGKYRCVRTDREGRSRILKEDHRGIFDYWSGFWRGIRAGSITAGYKYIGNQFRTPRRRRSRSAGW